MSTNHLLGTRKSVSVALCCCALLIAGLLAVANESALATRPDPTAPALPGFSGERVLLKEATDAADCISGPGEEPTPTGLSAAECLAMFDDDEDGDFDLADYHAYLNAIPPGLELGYSFDQPYDRLVDGDVVIVHQGGQGGLHAFITVHDTGTVNGDGFEGFPMLINLTRGAVLVDTGEVLVFTQTLLTQFYEIPDGILELANVFFSLQLAPGQADGRLADFTITVASYNDPTNTATLTRRLLLQEGG